MTVLDFITKVMLTLGCINQGDTPNNSEASQIFDATNLRLNLWTADALFIFGVTELTLPLLAATQSYEIGTGGITINAVRPMIRHARVQLPNSSVQLPMDVVGQAEWNAIEELSLTGQRPQKLFPNYNWPIMLAKVWPIPSVNMTAILQVWTQLVQFAAVTDPMDLPQGYLFALLYQVAYDVYPSFASQVPPTNLQIITQTAGMAEQTVRGLNAQYVTGRASGPVPEMAAAPVQPMPNAQASPGQPPQ